MVVNDEKQPRALDVDAVLLLIFEDEDEGRETSCLAIAVLFYVVQMWQDMF
jgi:hypothetical protein